VQNWSLHHIYFNMLCVESGAVGGSAVDQVAPAVLFHWANLLEKLSVWRDPRAVRIYPQICYPVSSVVPSSCLYSLCSDTVLGREDSGTPLVNCTQQMCSNWRKKQSKIEGYFFDNCSLNNDFLTLGLWIR
jgi:hypothetical protein